MRVFSTDFHTNKTILTLFREMIVPFNHHLIRAYAFSQSAFATYFDLMFSAKWIIQLIKQITKSIRAEDKIKEASSGTVFIRKTVFF